MTADDPRVQRARDALAALDSAGLPWRADPAESTLTRPSDTYDAITQSTFPVGQCVTHAEAVGIAALPDAVRDLLAAYSEQGALLAEDRSFRHRAIRAEAEVERLRRWKDEAIPVMLGLQDLGKALGVPYGQRITGETGVEAAEKLRDERDRLRACVDRMIKMAADEQDYELAAIINEHLS